MFANKTHKKADEVFKSGDIKKSIILYSKALKESPNEPIIFSDRGVAYLHSKEKEKSLADFNRAIELEPDYGYHYAARAFAKNNFGDIDGAILDYEEAIKMDPDDAIGQNNLGILLEKKGYQKEAEKHFKIADSLSKMEDELFDVIKDIEETNNENKSKEKINKKSTKSELKKLFTSKIQFQEFIKFLKNGLKIK